MARQGGEGEKAGRGEEGLLPTAQPLALAPPALWQLTTTQLQARVPAPALASAPALAPALLGPWQSPTTQPLTLAAPEPWQPHVTPPQTPQ